MLLLLGCATETVVGGYRLTTQDEGLDIVRDDGKVIVTGLRFGVGEGDEEIEFSAGNYRIASGDTTWTTLLPVARTEGLPLYDLVDDAGAVRGALRVEPGPTLTASVDGNRIRWEAPCTGDDHFAGLGEHAMDVDHVGQAFPLWVSEPGIGKDETEEASGFPIEGARHASSMPDPFLLRPEPYGLLVEGDARVEVDLCTSDTWTVARWSGTARFDVLDADTTLDVIRARTLRFGPPALPPDWAWAPWNDAVGGEARVRAVAQALRDAGAPAGVIWTEDWKGAEESSFGYRLLPEWQVDTTLYPDAAGLDAELEALGIKWFAYFSPFLSTESSNWAEAQDFTIKTADGAPYTFVGATLNDESVLDLSRDDARAWAIEKMTAARDLGFDGWMADYAEWLPTDAVLENADALDSHNAYPLWWQQIQGDVLDHTWFSRSGWPGSNHLSGMHWPGDQRTSFDADDGYPTVLPLLMGDGLAGVSITGSDIAGYQSIGNDPSTQELWFRWTTLGAYSPLMRTHHGAFAAENQAFDSSAENLAHWARYTTEHTLLFPYLRGLAARYATDGTPIVAPPFLRHPEEPWGRLDAMLLGDLLVAPVLVEGATSRQVDLPAGTAWYDLRTGAHAESGVFDAPIDEIPVFAPAGAIIPRFAEAPDSLVDGPLPGLRTRGDVDGARVITVYAGAAGSFTEADGTTYSTDGNATGAGTITDTLASGSLTAGGLRLDIAGATDRAYTLVVVN